MKYKVEWALNIKQITNKPSFTLSPSKFRVRRFDLTYFNKNRVKRVNKYMHCNTYIFIFYFYFYLPTNDNKRENIICWLRSFRIPAIKSGQLSVNSYIWTRVRSDFTGTTNIVRQSIQKGKAEQTLIPKQGGRRSAKLLQRHVWKTHAKASVRPVP